MGKAAPGYLKCSCTHCAGHIEFPDHAVGAEIACPHCGQETALSAVKGGGKGGKVVAVVATVLLLVGGAVGVVAYKKRSAGGAGEGTVAEKPAVESTPATASGTPPPEVATLTPISTPEPEPARNDELHLVQFGLPKVRGSSLVYVQGTVTNRAKVQYFSLKIEFDLLDKKGEKIGTAVDQLANLAPRSTWNFKALVVGKEVVDARLASLKGERE